MSEIKQWKAIGLHDDATAEVGQTIRVKAVDENNLPIEWETVDAQVDWDEVTNKPFVKVGGDTLTWDGNTEGLVSYNNGYYKVSDAIITRNDVYNGLVLVFAGEEISLDGEQAQSYFNRDDGYVELAEFVRIIPTDNYEDPANPGKFYPEAGMYLASESSEYVSSLTIPGYTGFAKEQIDPKVLPEALQFGETTVSSDTLEWDGNTEGLVSVDYTSELGVVIYKISSAVPTETDFANGAVATLNGGAQITEGLVAMAQNGAILGAEMLFMVIPSDNYELDAGMTPVPEKGVYFAIAAGTYITSLTIPNYTGFTRTEIKPIEEKFIPDTVPTIQSATVGQTIRVSAVDENGVPTEWEAVDMPDKLSDLTNDSGFVNEGFVNDAISKIPAPDVSGQIDAHNENEAAHADIRNLIPTTLKDFGVTATTDELNYVDGVTSNIQTQLNGKQATITGAATSITSANLTANRALVSNGSGKVAVSAVTSTELGYLDGVTSAVQSQLDAKIPLAGVSDYTITGNLLFADSGTAESAFRGLQGKCGDNDYWRVGGRATANNAGYMEIATADDGTEPIYVRQYTGVYSTLTRTATLLDGSGNTSFPGRVTAAGATLTSSLNLANGIWNKLGDDVLFGDNNTAGGFAIKGTNGNTNLKMVSNSNDTSASIVYDSTDECLNFAFA